MAAIDFGEVLIAKSGSQELDDVILDPVPWKKKDGSSYRVAFDGPEHILTIGPTRSGKGRRLLTPELIHDKDRSIIVVDPKGELAKWTAAQRAEYGEVWVIDPFGELAGQPGFQAESVGYNPLRWLSPSSVDFVDDATAIAEAICPVESKREPHFDQGAQDIVTGLILYHRTLSETAHLGNVRHDLSKDRGGWADLLAGGENGLTRDGKDCVFLTAESSGNAVMLRKLAELASLRPEDRELLSFVRSAKTKTNCLDSPPVAADLAKPGADFSELKKRTVTVYIVLPPIRLVTHARWLRLVISGAIEALRKTPAVRGRPDTLIILDEFPQLGRMQSVETGVQLNAGYGIKFWIVLQNITQLQDLYERNWETFTSAGVLTAFGPRDPTTSEQLAKLAAKRTFDVISDSHDADGRHSVSVSRQGRENVMPHQFEQLGKGRMFVRLPSDRMGVERYITHLPDFTERDDVPEAVRVLGR